MNDPIEELIEQIRGCRETANARFTTNLLDLMSQCPAVRQRRAIGRTLFKVLIAIQQSAPSGQSARGNAR